MIFKFHLKIINTVLKCCRNFVAKNHDFYITKILQKSILFRYSDYEKYFYKKKL